MISEKGIMKTEAIFSDDRRNRYLLRKEWDAKKPKAVIIMTNPSTADINSLDYTTLYILNNLIKLDFGSVDIVNITAKTTTKLDLKESLDSITDDENLNCIVKSAEKADKIIIAWGKIGENNKKIRSIQNKLLEQLKSFEGKLYLIASETGESGFHPLASQIRFGWILQKYEIPALPKEKPKDKKAKTIQDKQLQTSE